MGVYCYHRLVIDNRCYDVGGLASYAGKTHQIVDIGGNLAVETLHEHLRHLRRSIHPALSAPAQPGQEEGLRTGEAQREVDKRNGELKMEN